MATYTNSDIAASSAFAEANNTIRLLRKLNEKAPHLTSWLNVTIRDATDEDFYIPSTLKNSAKVVTVEMTEDICKLLSCNPMKEQDNCKPNNTASYYYVGDNAYDVQCQPACFNTATKITYNENNERAVDMPQLNWNTLQSKCRIVNANVTAFLEKTFYRSDTKFELRVNDMPTGFSKIASDNPYGAGFTYKTNKSYCNYYDKTLQSDGSCQMTLLEKILDAIIGQTLINYIKSGIRMLTNDGVPFELPKNLPTLPSSLETVHTLDGWRNNVNADFVLPSIIDTTPQTATAGKSLRSKRSIDTPPNIHDARRKAEMESMDSMSNFMRTCMGLEIITDLDKILGLDEFGEILQPMGSTPMRRDGSTTSTETTSTHWTEKMKEIFVELLKMFTEGDTYFYIGVDVASQLALKQIKSLSIKIVEKMSAYLAKGLFDITGSIGIKVLTSGIKGMAVKMVTGMAIRTGAKLSIMLAKMLGAAASVIGWLLVGTMLLDLLFTFWDPLGYSNMYPPELPNDMMESGELSLRQALAAPTANFEFENFASVILSEDEIMELQLESLIDRLIYLDALVVNSEGSRIDKGTEINISTGSTYEMESAQNAGMAERVKFNSENFEIYNDRFMSRVEINKYLNYISASSVVISGILMVARLPLLSFVAIIVALIVLAISRLELQDDILVDLVDKYKNKTPIYGNDENKYGYSMI
ncbi:OrNV p74-like protein [Tomelloso virus]|uniref:OrNV p74-like protein n=1 Tax=Tomelloso virus TaxID=2053981 RepID=A0A2H4T2M7_9VIRU|nr:OrNV p74-like protein [Tomelloso virus]ATY70182.1 OrNV p74-like protein [Tomelloso virus]